MLYYFFNYAGMPSIVVNGSKSLHHLQYSKMIFNKIVFLWTYIDAQCVQTVFLLKHQIIHKWARYAIIRHCALILTILTKISNVHCQALFETPNLTVYMFHAQKLIIGESTEL